MIEMIDWHFLSKGKINKVRKEFGATKHSIWYCYNTKYKVCLLVNLFFWKYVYAIIQKEYMKHIDEDDIDKYVDNIFEDILPHH